MCGGIYYVNVNEGFTVYNGFIYVCMYVIYFIMTVKCGCKYTSMVHVVQEEDVF